MKPAIAQTYVWIVAVLLGLLVLTRFLTLTARADVRAADRADRGTTGRTVTPPPAPTPAPPPPPTPPASGGITSTTDGSVNTGGNQGGNVTTGDEHVDVVEVNIGPTNPPPPPPSVSPNPPPPPTCDSRTRVGCVTDTRVR